MAEAKHILVVDDHFEMLEFLRSMLELSNQDYEVLAVPSAEEGLFELRRAQFDLIITDVRLPGMSGFDLVRRVRKLGRKTPVIMITAYSSTQGKKEAEELGVYRYFKKPLDTDNVLTAVHTALHGESVDLTAPVPRGNAVKSVSASVKKRLEALRTDTGAVQLMLATIQGEVVFADGQSDRLELNGLAEIIARNIQDSFLLAEKLNSRTPFSLQYHAGGRIELYCANVGRDHFLTLFYETSSRRGRIGTIWLFTQRAIKDMVGLLSKGDLSKGDLSKDDLSENDLSESDMEKVPAHPVETTPEAVDAFLHGAFDTLIDDTPVVAETAVSAPAAAEAKTPDPIIEIPELAEPDENRLELQPLEVDDSELMALLANAPQKQEKGVDLDAFWDDALTQQDDELARGLTLEEAQRRGLIPSELDSEEDGS